MLRYLLVALLLLGPSAARAQSIYTGTLGRQPITLVAYVYSDGAVTAHYAYDRYDTPIRVNGQRADGVLVLDEKDAQGHAVATLRLRIEADGKALRGEWVPVDGKASQPIALAEKLAVDPYSPHAGAPVEVPQQASTAEHWFTVSIASPDAKAWPRVVALNAYRKRTDERVQRIGLDTQYRGIDSVDTGDFDFDGILDVSVFEHAYAGPNTSSLYFLWDTATRQYVAAEFEGTSLEFDAKSKRVIERNSCCMGRSQTIATYRVVGRKLELVERTCREMTEDGDDLVEVPCGE
jgi:hypothetical protein